LQSLTMPGQENKLMGYASMLNKVPESPWADPRPDDIGNIWGINKRTGRAEIIPANSPFVKYQTVQGTDEHGMPITKLVSPALAAGAGKNLSQVPNYQNQFSLGWPGNSLSSNVNALSGAQNAPQNMPQNIPPNAASLGGGAGLPSELGVSSTKTRLPISEYQNLIDTKTGKSPLPSENLIQGELPKNIIARQATPSSDVVGKESMVDTARIQMPIINKTLFDNGDPATGKINKDILFPAEILRANIPIVSYLARYAAPDNAIRLANAYEYGIQGITRFETGAAMAPTEVGNTAKRFMPLNTDPEDVIRNKVAAYQLFLNHAKDYIDPNKIKEGGKLTVDDVNFDKVMSDAAKLNKTDAKPLSDKSKSIPSYDPVTHKWSDQ
jgi:hypothetical protein